MNIETMSTNTIRDIALEALATTRIFEEFKIDYCCGGRRSIADACSTAGIDSVELNAKLQEVLGISISDSEEHPEDLSPAELLNYIVATHHLFTASELQRLTPLMEKVVMRHGENHPELLELEKLFTALRESLTPHMRKEENVLFPYIETLQRATETGSNLVPPHFVTVNNPIRMMMSEHDTDGERLLSMRRATADYQIPEGACPSFRALYAGLQDLERDLHRHIHLENNVLFPRASELERELLQGTH